MQVLQRFILLFRNLTITKLKNLISTKESKGALLLYGAQIASIVLAFSSQKINTNFLTKDEFGAVTWCTQILVLLHPLFEFGFFLSGTKLLSRLENKEDVRKMYGILIVVMLVIATAFSILLTVFTVLFPFLLKDTLVYYGMLVSSSFAWTYIVQFFLQSVLQGAGDVHYLSIYTLTSRLLSVTFLACWIYFFKLSVQTSLLFNLAAMGICGVLILIRLRPIFEKNKDLYRLLKNENKEYGWQIYIGKLVSVPTFQLAPVMIPYFSTISSSAIYGVASNLVVPMVQATQAISQSLFKNFSQQKKLKDRLLIVNFVTLVVVGSIVYFGAPFLVTLSANKTYQQAIPYMFPLVIGGFFQGFWQPFHQFSLARGKGEWMKHQLIMGAFVDLISSVILVPLWGLEGACWQFCISRFLRFFFALHNYQKTIKYVAHLESSKALI